MTTIESPTVEQASERAAVSAPRTGRSLGGSVLSVLTGPGRVVVVLVIIAVIFQSLNSAFLLPGNLSNLVLQVIPTALISVGIVLVLLLGEIDLSAGAVSGLAGAVLAVALTQGGMPAVAAIGVAVLAGAIIGLAQGIAVVALKLPSFIVTLAGLLAWQGGQLAVLGGNGTINLANPTIVGISSRFLPAGVTIGMLAIGLVVYAVLQYRRRGEQRGAGVEVESLRATSLRVVGVAVVAVCVTGVLLADRGVPVSFAILVAIILGINYILTGSRTGRHLIAVGGNAESARRVGINVTRMKIGAFAAGSALAAAGGVLAASRLQAATQSAGGSDLLLLAIAGPVIAGVSLFGGRGSVWAALIGAVVIGAISNGMDLLGLDASVKYIVTGGVLFLAVATDALSRIRRAKSGGSRQ